MVTKADDKLRIRYLTPRECLRLMAFADPEIDRLIEAVPSKTNQHKLAGNSIVVSCLEAIFRGIYIDRTFRQSAPKQVTLTEFSKPKSVNPILGRTAEEIEEEAAELDRRIREESVEVSGGSIVENSGGYVGGNLFDQC